MSANRESVGKTILVATILCVVCSFVVSTVAVKLKPLQKQNQQLDMKKNILMAAGLLEDAKSQDIEEIYRENVSSALINFQTGEEVEGDADKFFVSKALKDPKQTVEIPDDKDVAGLNKRTKLGKIYYIKEEGQVSGVILPIVAKGLWSTMYGFIALSNDTKTVKGFGFYKQGETPGLGGEVDNPKWKAQWVGKEIYNENWENVFQIVQGGVASDAEQREHKIDGLSGATITAKGVESSIQYWLGESGYGPFLSNLRQDLSGVREEATEEVSSES